MPLDFTPVDSVIQDRLDKAFPAAQIEIRIGGETVFARAYGWLDPETRQHPTNLETRFDLASVSKLFTTAAFMTYVEQGRIRLDQRVADLLPEFTGARPITPYPDPLHPGQFIAVTPDTTAVVDASRVTFRNLLAHNSGLPAWRALYQLHSPAEMRAAALTTFFSYPTGTRVVYSDIGLILIGMALERLAGQRLDAIVRERVTAPLGLSSVRYGPMPCENVAPTDYFERLGRRMCGEVDDENAWGLGGVAGHAGLFATAHDLATFVEMTRVQASDGVVRRGIGFLLWSPDPEASSHPLSERAFGHNGFTGTSLWIDPARELVIACLTNRVYYGRESADPINAFRVALHRAVCRVVDEAHL